MSLCLLACSAAAAAPGDSHGKTCCCGSESRKELLLSTGSWSVLGCIQPHRAPPAVIGGERTKCRFLGNGRGSVSSGRQQWKIGGGEGAGLENGQLSTFLGAGKHVACSGSRQSLFFEAALFLVGIG